MKRKTSLTVALLLLLFAGANAQDAVFLSDVTGTWDGGTKVMTGVQITFTIGFDIPAAPITGATNGFEIFVADYPGSYAGAYTFQSPTWSTNGAIPGWWDGGNFVNPINVDGFGADTIGFSGFSLFTQGIPTGYYYNMYAITTQLSSAVAGKYLCLDSCWYPPGGLWLWSAEGASIVPTWDGPHCFYIESFECPPDFVNFPYGAR